MLRLAVALCALARAAEDYPDYVLVEEHHHVVPFLLEAVASGKLAAGATLVHFDSHHDGGLPEKLWTESETHDALLEQVSTSLGALGVPSVGILYLHSPDQDAPLEGALAAVDELHRQGKIREFGLSNFSAWQTVQVYYKCKELGYVLPTVYQGVFSAKLIIENCRGFAFANRSK